MADAAFVLRGGGMALLEAARAMTPRVRGRMLAAKPDLPPPRRLRWQDA
jgi:hypothetical protein